MKLFNRNKDSDEEEAVEMVPQEQEEPTKEKGRGPSVHYGDEGYEEAIDLDGMDQIDISDTTWGEVARNCCCHSFKEWAVIGANLVGICFFLYWFIFSLELLGTGAKVLTGCAAAGLFGGNTNPVASLIVGMLVTVLLQSSSTTTSIIVSLVGAGSIPVEPAIYMVMGANIGTSVTNTIVAMGQMGNGGELERAFAGATVHDMFNFLSVCILFPLEIITHMLARMTSKMTENYNPNSEGSKKSSGIKTIISPILDRIIISNKSVINDVATGGSCDEYYPTECNPPGTHTYQACVKDGKVGLITCSKSGGYCPAFFEEGATQSSDTVSGAIALVLGIIFLVICLMGLVMVLKHMLLGASTRIIKKATAINGYVSMLIGAGITIAVQSSSVTTSVLTPLVGVGLVTVDQMFPLTLGANIGTTITSMLAAVVADTADSMQVALAHFFFNIFGICIWYPIPFMRRIPIHMAKALGKATRWWRGFPLLYLAVVFFVIPLILLGISALFVNGSSALAVLGSIIVIGLAFSLAKFLWWWFKRDGAAKTEANFKSRQHKKDIAARLVDEWEPLVAEVKALKDHVGLEDETDESDESDNIKKPDIETVHENEGEVEKTEMD
jgi:sodium-dependent phosphate cotransporter